MITKIRLTNFKTHRDLEIQFGSGLQTIRGAVEAGKSSLIEAIAYGFLGSAVLPATLAETVTWGQPESSLRVELEFLHAGQPFSIYRGKSGAELTGAGVRASGQAEVTRFCEGLFGCPASVVKQVLLATQGDLRGTLDAGPGETVQLIERLGNVELLDSIVGKIQDQLPCGSTLALDTLVNRERAVPQPGQVDHSQAEAAIQRAQALVGGMQAAISAANLELNALNVASANQALGTATAAAERLARARTRLTQADLVWKAGEAALAAELEKPAVNIEDLMRRKAQAADVVRQLGVHKAFQGTHRKDVWVGSLDSLRAAKSECDKTISDARVEGQRQAVAVAGWQAQIISETACGLCGKDLTDVPEVVAKNAGLSGKIRLSTLAQGALKEKIKAATEAGQVLEAILVADAARHTLAQSNPDLVAYTTTTVIPGTLTWLGFEALTEVGTNFDADIKAAQDAATRLLRLRNAAEISRAAWVDAQAEERAAASVDVDLVGPKAVLAQAEKITAQVRSLSNDVAESKTAHQSLVKALEQVQAMETSQAVAFKAAQARLADLHQDLTAMHLHNQVIKRVREVRPVVANKLWDLVLSSVSQYFSKVRGLASVVSRGDKGFSVDGHPVRTLSGSTKDALGLAIRLSLAKTFLPALGFLIMDEPAASCDDERELSMLGLLSACDFDQIIMVTHSDLADAYSTNIIQL